MTPVRQSELIAAVENALSISNEIEHKHTK